jgi:hypothetical protein
MRRGGVADYELKSRKGLDATTMSLLQCLVLRYVLIYYAD